VVICEIKLFRNNSNCKHGLANQSSIFGKLGLPIKISPHIHTPKVLLRTHAGTHIPHFTKHCCGPSWELVKSPVLLNGDVWRAHYGGEACKPLDDKSERRWTATPDVTAAVAWYVVKYSSFQTRSWFGIFWFCNTIKNSKQHTSRTGIERGDQGPCSGSRAWQRRSSARTRVSAGLNLILCDSAGSVLHLFL